MYTRRQFRAAAIITFQSKQTCTGSSVVHQQLAQDWHQGCRWRLSWPIYPIEQSLAERGAARKNHPDGSGGDLPKSQQALN